MPGTPNKAPLTPQLVLDGLNIFAKKFFKETTKPEPQAHSRGLGCRCLRQYR